MRLEDLYDFFRKKWYPQPEESVEIQNQKLQRIVNLGELYSQDSKDALDEYLKLKNEVK
jgi:hypothetical protein